MSNKYMILIQKYTDKGLGFQIVDNWYLKDTVYPGTLLFDDYTEALSQAARETYDVKTEDRIIKERYRGHVILCQETPKPKKYHTK